MSKEDKREKIRVEFPEDYNGKQIDALKQELFKWLVSHNCRLKEVKDA